jgi:hypothetical protein
MFYKESKLEEIIEGMRALGDMLIPYNFPKAPPPTTMEDDLAIFKQREAIIDGYPIMLHYQKADYDKHLMETLQIYGKSSPFLPFNLICKLAKRFLGPYHLSLVEIFKDNRKIYIWSVCVDRRGRPIPAPFDTETEECEFEGLDYLYMQPSQVNFY